MGSHNRQRPSACLKTFYSQHFMISVWRKIGHEPFVRVKAGLFWFTSQSQTTTCQPFESGMVTALALPSWSLVAIAWLTACQATDVSKVCSLGSVPCAVRSLLEDLMLKEQERKGAVHSSWLHGLQVRGLGVVHQLRPTPGFHLQYAGGVGTDLKVASRI